MHPGWSRGETARFIETQLVEGVTLVDAQYLVALSEAGGVVPSWVDVPECARIGRETLWRLQWSTDGVLVLSCKSNLPEPSPVPAR